MSRVVSADAVVVDVVAIRDQYVAAPKAHLSSWHLAATKPAATMRTRAFGYPTGFRPHTDRRSWVIV